MEVYFLKNFLTNNEIKANKVLLIFEDNSKKEMSLKEALKEAEKQNLDLIQISTQEIPICKLVDYNKFIIYEPKRREIVSQGVQDKIINHLVARHILYPAILPCLLDVNVASRKDMGTSRGLELALKFHNKCKIKYGTYYVLKCDISKFFLNINHDILKQKVLRRIKDKDALKIVFDIIDSNEEGLYIGSMTSQVLAIFYLNDMDHFIKETLKIKYYVRYQDDFLLFHQSKDYLKYCLKEIEKFLTKEKLKLNIKTRIYKNTNNFLFLGRNTSRTIC